MVKELGMKPKQMKLIINRAPEGELAEGIREEIRIQGLDLAGVIPQDPMVYQYDTEGKPTSLLPENSPSRKAFEKIVESLKL